MATGARRLGRRRRRIRAVAVKVRREAPYLTLLAAASLLIGALFQEPVAYGWVAGAAAGLLLVRMALRFEQTPDAAETAPAPAGRGDWRGALRDGLTLLAHMGTLTLVTYAIADAIKLDRGATSQGNEALLIAAAWGAYGLMLILTAPLVSPVLPWKPLGQAVFTFALGFLLMGGLMAQGRWADPWPRYTAYAAVPGAVLAAALLQRRRGRLEEPDRLLALAALILGFGICSFEAKRWLEPVLTYPMGTTVSAELLARGQNLVNAVSLALWALYSLLVWGLGAWLRSRTLRFLGGALGASAGVYLLVSLLLLAVR